MDEKTGQIGGYMSENVDNDTVKNTLIRVELGGTKTWNDYSNYYQTRPDELKLTLSNQKGVLPLQPEIDWTKDGESDKWTYQITGLPKYVPGTDEVAAYRVEETVPTEYEAEAETVRVDAKGQADLTNTLKNPLASVTIVKHANSLDGQRLAGASYILCREKEDGSVEYLTDIKDGIAVFGANRASARQLTTGENGELTVSGLNYGKYWFLEVNPPEGYQLKEDPITFEISLANKAEVQTVEQFDPAVPAVPSDPSGNPSGTNQANTNIRTGDGTEPTSLWICLGVSGLLIIVLALIFWHRRKTSDQK